MNTDERYDIIEHTADIGIRAYGRTKKELFTNAATGMFEFIADLNNARTLKTLTLKIEADSIEELLISWLEELLYQFDTKKILFKRFIIEKLSCNKLTAKVSGERLAPKRHILYREIKAVTYHELRVARVKTRWEASVIFDI